MSTVVECTVLECNHGEGGIRWRTPALPDWDAIEMLKLHRVDVHGKHVGGGGAALNDGEGQDQLAKIPRPVIGGGCRGLQIL